MDEDEDKIPAAPVELPLNNEDDLREFFGSPHFEGNLEKQDCRTMKMSNEVGLHNGANFGAKATFAIGSISLVRALGDATDKKEKTKILQKARASMIQFVKDNKYPGGVQLNELEDYNKTIERIKNITENIYHFPRYVCHEFFWNARACGLPEDPLDYDNVLAGDTWDEDDEDDYV